MRGALVIALLACAAVAETPLAWAERARLRGLLERLGASDPCMRAAAEAELQEECARLGRPALEWLELHDLRDPEARAARDAVCARVATWLWVRAHLAPFDGVVPPCADSPFGRSPAGAGFLLPGGAFLLLDLAEADAVGFDEDDFAAHCERRLAGDPAPQPRDVSEALLAYWAWHRGHRDLAVRLWGDRPASRGLRDGLVGLLRRRAVLLARDGAPRERLAAEWRTIARLDRGNIVAPLIVMGYEREVRDARAGADDDLVARLRDSRVQPAVLGVDWGPDGDPALDLLEAGWDAVPVLVAHLRDTRPTRGSATDLQREPPAAAQPCTVGWTCLRILEGIAGRTFRHEAAAELWWEGARTRGARGHYLALLARRDLPEWQRRLAARALLRIDRERYEPLVRDQAKESPVLLLEVEPLDAATREALLKSVEGDPVRTAEVLWTRCGDDTGIRRIADALRHGRDTYALARPEEIRFLCSVRSDRAATEVCWFLRHGASRTRALFVREAHACRDRRVLDALLETMKERVSYVELDGGGYRVCDLAAVSMVWMLEGGAVELPDDPKARNDSLDRLADWATLRRQGVDWAK